jgi:biotin synthase-related radical SAM superfamily protein
MDGRDHQVKLAVAQEGDADAPLCLEVLGDGGLGIRGNDGVMLLSGVRLLPIVMHAPDHAFINLDGDCRYACAFCTTHLMDPRRRNLRDPERWVELVLEAHAKRPFEGLAITSVALSDHEELMSTYEAIIRGVLDRLPHLTVGVEPYVEGPEDITRLRAAGAREIKINVQSPVAAILTRICPGWELERQYGLLAEAVRIFGRGKVTTNIIIGLGESDRDVEDALDRLTAMGVVPSVRAVRVNDLNRPHLEEALGHELVPVDPDRHLKLAGSLRDALERNGLTVGSFDTMCHKCGCCDLEPGVDI